jgi:hypothetical protein
MLSPLPCSLSRDAIGYGEKGKGEPVDGAKTATFVRIARIRTFEKAMSDRSNLPHQNPPQCFDFAQNVDAPKGRRATCDASEPPRSYPKQEGAIQI